MSMSQQTRPYSWRYTDVRAGDLTVVVIFMYAPVFSARELRRERAGLPSLLAINVAVYQAGKRKHWVFTEYDTGIAERAQWVVGRSSLRQTTAGVHLVVNEKTVTGEPLQLVMSLTPQTPSGSLVTLSPGKSHYWQSLMPRAEATLQLNGSSVVGHGYHDMNFGTSPLGTDLAGWNWSRLHRANHSIIRYSVNGEADDRLVVAREEQTSTLSVQRSSLSPATESGVMTNGWGLAVPRSVSFGSLGGVMSAGALIESSPFYTRQESEQRLHQANTGPTETMLTEVADFSRFRSPLCWWMPYFRSRKADVSELAPAPEGQVA